MRALSWKSILISVISSLWLFAVQTPAEAQGWSNGYTYRRVVTIDHTKVPNTDQTNFPFLFSGTYSYLATTGNGGNVTSANGYDIIFTSDANGTMVLPFEQESYNAATGAVNYWVQIPTVSHTSDTVFYMFYGNSSVTTDQSNKNGVWDSNYKGVWHFGNGTSLNTNDSTSNSNNLTNNGATATSSGPIYGGASFASGSSQYLSETNFTLGATSLTASGWVNSSNFAQYGMLLEEDAVNANWELFFENSNGNEGQAGLKLRGGSATGFAANFPSNGAWHYVVGTISGTSGKIYIDGALAASGTVAAIPSNNTNQLNIGRFTSWYYFNGSMDEARVSNIARSADWIATEYNNQSSPSSFYYEDTPTITNLSPTSGGIGTSVTISGHNFGAQQGTSKVYFNGSQATSITSWSDSQIVAAVPSTATTGPVTVVANGIGSNSNFVFAFYNPVISNLSPSAGPAGGSVTLTGSGFGATQSSSTVQFNSVAASVSSWSDTSTVVTVPSNATSGPVTVTVGGVTSNGAQFTALGSLSITAISAGTGPIGMSVTITGTGFGSTQGNSSASFNSAIAAVTSWSNSQIIAVVPVTASVGPVSVQVDNVTAQGPTFVPIVKAQVTDSLGNSSNYAGAIAGGQWRATDAQGSGCSTCTVRGTTHYQYDAFGNVTSKTDPRGNQTSYTYDSANNVLSETVQVDSTHTATTSYTYNSFGEVLTVTDPLGNVTTNAYDAHGNLFGDLADTQ